SSRPKRKPLLPGSLFDSDKILFLARDIPYNDYARAVTRIRSVAVSSDIIKQRRIDSIYLRYSIPRHFLKSYNLYLARYPSILRPTRDLISAPHYPYS
ncbi:hypothetical protein L249_8107, partial [Ophiocordyceps polyrhachis-furcata BCC 54312]